MPSVVKEIMLKEIAQAFESNPYAFISSFDALTVADISDLRRNLEKVAKRSVVIKHTLAKKVLSKLQLASAEKLLQGNVLLTIADKEPQSISKTLVDFAKSNKKLVPAGVVFEKKVYDAEFVKSLAQLPSRQELLTQVVVRVKSPITGLVMTLGQVLRGLAVVLNEVKKKKEAAPTTS